MPPRDPAAEGEGQAFCVPTPYPTQRHSGEFRNKVRKKKKRDSEAERANEGLLGLSGLILQTTLLLPVLRHR